MGVFFTALGALLLLAAVIWLGCSAHYFDKLLSRTPRKRGGGELQSGPLARFFADNARAKQEIQRRGIAQPMEIYAADGVPLRAVLLQAKQKSNSYVVCVHGYRSSGFGDFAAIGLSLWEQVYNVLLLDDRAHGESGGKYIGMGVLDRDDIVAWCQYLVLLRGADIRIMLHGMSMGAASVLMAAAEEHLPAQVCGVVEDCGFSSGPRLFGTLVNLRGSRTVRRALLWGMNLFSLLFANYSLYDARPDLAVSKIELPVLFIHGGADDYVPTEMARELYERCSSPKLLYIAEGAWHACSFLTDPDRYLGQLQIFYQACGF